MYRATLCQKDRDLTATGSKMVSPVVFLKDLCLGALVLAQGFPVRSPKSWQLRGCGRLKLLGARLAGWLSSWCAMSSGDPYLCCPAGLQTAIAGRFCGIAFGPNIVASTGTPCCSPTRIQKPCSFPVIHIMAIEIARFCGLLSLQPQDRPLNPLEF